MSFRSALTRVAGAASSLRHFTATLDKFTALAKEKGELLGIVGSLKNDIVEKAM
ncbi:MAG: hypothetical protein ACRENH_04805 [Gemmatimonadaceae bacterium]